MQAIDTNSFVLYAVGAQGSSSAPVIDRIVSYTSPTVLTVECKVVWKIFSKTDSDYGCWNVPKAEIFIICFIFMFYEALFLLCMSYLCYMFYYIFVTYLYVYYLFLIFFLHFYFHIIWI